MSVTSLTREKLKRSATIYTVVFRHDEDSMSFIAHDIQDTKKDRLAVASDFEAAALSLKDDA